MQVLIDDSPLYVHVLGCIYFIIDVYPMLFYVIGNYWEIWNIFKDVNTGLHPCFFYLAK